LNRLREKEEETVKVLNAIVEESACGTPILVEGRKDEEALRRLGVEGRIVRIKTGGKSFLGVATQIEHEKLPKVILLLDFDRRGKQATNRMRRMLEHAGVKVDLEFWLALLGPVGKDVQCVEGLEGYLATLHLKTEGSRRKI
jgi:5S rRNA maturation endonuclease (ribonuclease M5)